MKKTLSKLIISSLLITNIFASNIQNISNRKYFETTHEQLQQAKQSIYMSMYLITFSEKRNNHINTLVRDLVNAHKRGVRVKVVLDQNIAFEKKDNLGISHPTYKNRSAYNHLKQEGIEVYYDDLHSYNHAKCIIIDQRFVIMGSTNWSMQALTRNTEISALIDSKQFAKELTQTINNIKIDTTKKQLENYITINKQQLINNLSKCITHRSITAWNIYFYLLHTQPTVIARSESDEAISLTYKQLEHTIHTRSGKLPKFDVYKKTIIRETLQSLDKKGLIKYHNIKDPNSNPSITLISSPMSSRTNVRDLSSSLKIPQTFFTYGWNKRLSILAQYCYFISLIEGTQDHLPWRASLTTTLNKRYKISKRSLRNGF